MINLDITPEEVSPVSDILKETVEEATVAEVVKPEIEPTDEALSANALVFRNSYHYTRLNPLTVERRRSAGEATTYSGEALKNMLKNQPRYLILKHGAASFFKISESELAKIKNMTLAEAIKADKLHSV